MSKKHVDRTDIRQKKAGLGSAVPHVSRDKQEAAWAAKSAVSAEARQKMIAEAAYYLAEKRGFAGNDTYNDWMKAEADIDAMLLSRIGKQHS